MNKASLVIVGSGIKFISHLTHEVKVYIEQANKVLYLVNDPAIKTLLHKMNANAKSLDKLYNQFPLRKDCYKAITDYILKTLDQTQDLLCVVLYGHPSMYAQPGLDAAKQAKASGFDAKILPGISAEACLFADLMIDPGTFGCQSFEATDFLIHKRKIDPSCHLILWQIDLIGVLNNPSSHDNKKGAQILVNYLKHYYPLDHEVILYEAAQYPTFSPNIQKFPLNELANTAASRISTLYLPPACLTSPDTITLKELGIDFNEL